MEPRGQPTINGFGRGCRAPKGLAMLIRSEIHGVRGWHGRRRLRPVNSGCVHAHPASWRASSAYRPLRAVWAFWAWALRGCMKSENPFGDHRRTSLKESSDDHCEQVRQGPRYHIRHHLTRRRAMPRRDHDLRGEARGRRDARRDGRRRHRGRFPDHLGRRFPGGQRDRPAVQERRDRGSVARAPEGHRSLRRSRASSPSAAASIP